jgi:hypothetical protein
VKRRDLIHVLLDHQCVLHRHGANHDIYINPRNGRKAPVPRHTDIKESLARLVLKQLRIEQ